MKALTKEDKKNICLEYKNGLSIDKIYKKYNISSRRVRNILLLNNITINNSHKKTISKDDYIEKVNERFKARDGYKFIAISKKDKTVYGDYLNKSGCLTQYIKNILGVEIPSLFKRKKYFHEHGEQWYEQFFEIIEVVDQKNETKKCPYCNWETIDVSNKSGMFETHLLKEHGITKIKYLKEHPEDREYFILANKTLDRRLEVDKRRYITCAICGEKLARIDWRHLAKHGITKEDYIKNYTETTVSEELHNNLSNNAIELNKNLKPTFISKPEIEIKNYIESLGIKCESSNRKILNGKEIDIYIPSLKLGIEYNGNFWHTNENVDKYKHINKTEDCKKKGVGLIQIFEDEFVNKKELVFATLKKILISNKGINTNLEYFIKKINVEQAKVFLNRYNIEGHVASKVYIGGFCDNELVSVMSFRRDAKVDNGWLLERFATKNSDIFDGVEEKMFKFFILNFLPKKISAFMDRRWMIGEENNIYTKLGFKFDCYTKPDYTYYCPKINKYKRFKKYEFKKINNCKVYKIWDCGLVKYVWKNNEK